MLCLLLLSQGRIRYDGDGGDDDGVMMPIVMMNVVVLKMPSFQPWAYLVHMYRSLSGD